MDFKSIYDHLKENGIDVYPPAVYSGPCKKPYVVVRRGICSLNIDMNRQEYELLIYIPYGKYATLEGYVEDVQGHMNTLYPELKLIDYGDPVYPDDDRKAYMTTLTYAVKKPLGLNRIVERKKENGN